MEIVPAQQQALMQALWDAGKSSIDAGVVDGTLKERWRYWNFWCDFQQKHTSGITPYLEYQDGRPLLLPVLFQILVTYAQFIWTGRHLNDVVDSTKPRK